MMEHPVNNFRQILVGLIANLSSMAFGNSLGWTSPVMAKLSDKNLTDSPLSVVIEDNSVESAWLASMLPLGAVITPFIAGPLADKIGRKWSLMCSSIFYIAAYVLFMIGNELWMFYCARLLQGFGVGFVMTAEPMYIGEISTDACRGALGSIISWASVVGILYVYAIGPFVSFMTLQWTLIVIPIIFAVTFVFMPESPYYYIQKGQKSKAITALQFLRGQTAEGVAAEIAVIERNLEEAERTKGSMWELFRNKANYKALIICLGLMFTQQLSGIDVVLFNTEKIFKYAKTNLDPSISAIIIACVELVFGSITPFIVDRIGRRIILLYSAATMAFSSALLGIYFWMDSIHYDISSFSWIPLMSLIMYVGGFFIGVGAIPWAILGEIFDQNVKGYATAISTSICWFLAFILTRTYAPLSAIGDQYVFLMYSSFLICGYFFILIFVFETKGMSLAEIQEKLNSK